MGTLTKSLSSLLWWDSIQVDRKLVGVIVALVLFFSTTPGSASNGGARSGRNESNRTGPGQHFTPDGGEKNFHGEIRNAFSERPKKEQKCIQDNVSTQRQQRRGMFFSVETESLWWIKIWNVFHFRGTAGTATNSNYCPLLVALAVCVAALPFSCISDSVGTGLVACAFWLTNTIYTLYEALCNVALTILGGLMFWGELWPAETCDGSIKIYDGILTFTCGQIFWSRALWLFLIVPMEISSLNNKELGVAATWPSAIKGAQWHSVF